MPRDDGNSPDVWPKAHEERRTWAEPSAAYLGRQRVPSEEVDRLRERFREMCVRQHGSVVGAWKVIDLNGDGRLTYFEFMRGCKKMDMKNARRVWCALAQGGFVSLKEVDPELGEELGSLAASIWVAFGNVEQAWRTCFNKSSKLRISHEDFNQACAELGYQGDSASCFKELCSEKASHGMSRKEFGFLHSWISKGPDRGYLEPSLSRWQQPVERWEPPPKQPKVKERRRRFMDCLLRSYGNVVRAWRQGLDRDHDDRMDYAEFTGAVRDVGYAGNPRELWEELDLNRNGYVSLWELDMKTARLLQEFVDTAKSCFGSWAQFWHEALDVRGDDRVLYPEFRDGCYMMSWPSESIGELFELLDTDRARYLSWATTSWLGGKAERPESGVKFTKAQSRAMQQRLREHRHRVKTFQSRARGEMPGSHPAAGTTIYSSVPLIEPLESKPSSAESVSRPLPQSALAEDLPDWLLVAQGRMRKPEPLPKADLSFPLKPQQPGKGGWPSSKLHLVDELWGGSKDLGLLLRPLTRKACSQESLERWRKMAATC